MTKAEEVFTKTEALIAKGKTKAEAFKQLAEEYGQPVNSIRGSYYAHTSAKVGSTPRSRRRETTPEDALADARASLERAIQSIDREAETARERAQEASAEYEAIQGSAQERKEAIEAKITALES